ncbi:hypothetical protein E2C01_020858 [Portunus trituberculatus]|uniref:Uncharacterized protein n=1 Tax=Portunus trituberculatus TaxID=210409 RepID=A0A5B7E2Q7_PORTR|nr:hypothetical protein [Portunus trituberculatus]
MRLHTACHRSIAVAVTAPPAKSHLKKSRSRPALYINRQLDLEEAEKHLCLPASQEAQQQLHPEGVLVLHFDVGLESFVGI